jgi:dTDP-4-dehydrorhamnose reductase
MKTNVLLLGKGYIGSHLFNHLENKETKHGTTISCTILNKKELDYTKFDTLNAFLKNNNYKLVINCSGFTGTPNIDQCEIEKYDTYYYNTVVPVTMASCCKLYSIDFAHISSGCIYNGYEKSWTEKDKPNFGIDCFNSSFYSKTKHMAEVHLADLNADIFRIRMPFSSDDSNRNYLTKIRRYNRLMSVLNSKTCVGDFCNFIYNFYFVINHSANQSSSRIYNVVNPNPLSTTEIVSVLRDYKLDNPNWVYTLESNLRLAAKRSNCTLSTEKIESMGLGLPSEKESLINICDAISIWTQL